ncbi:hypothetical protein F5883DRAFT_720776 [Diaporthe sp. PMI_573]|nr:hypothetical protein F5883DRAFT_720776 [Diaporthaceae sp. PMI_573]
MSSTNDLEPGDWFHRANIWLKYDVNCSPFEYCYFNVKFSYGTWLLLLLDLALHGMLAGVDIYTIILWTDAGFVYRAALASLGVCGLAFMLNMSILFVSFAHGYIATIFLQSVLVAFRPVAMTGLTATIQKPLSNFRFKHPQHGDFYVDASTDGKWIMFLNHSSEKQN